MTLKHAIYGFAAVATMGLAGGAQAADQQFVTIGTGGVTGVYYPTGGAICRLVNKGRKEHGIRCSVESTGGSVYNINTIREGELQFGVAQSDWQHHAFNGTSKFEEAGAFEGLRAVFSVHPEPFTVVARADAGISTFDDLKGKRVSIDEPGSGTIVDARIVLGAFGLTEDDIEAEHLKPGPAGDMLRDGALDAYFFVGGYPTGAVSELATSAGISLVPISGPEVDKLLEEYSFFSKDTVPAETYSGVAETPTISVAAQWVTSAKQSDDLVYNITKTMWDENTRKELDAGHAKGKMITLQNATTSLGIPLHPGAERFYKEVGALK